MKKTLIGLMMAPLFGALAITSPLMAEDKDASTWGNWGDTGKCDNDDIHMVTTPDALYSRAMLPLKSKAEVSTLLDGTTKYPSLVYKASDIFQHYYMVKNNRIYHVGLTYFGEYLPDPPGFVEQKFYTRCPGEPNPGLLPKGSIPFPPKPRVEIRAQVVTNMMARQEPMEKIKPVLDSIDTLKDVSISPFDGTLQKVWPAGMLPPLTWAVVNHANPEYVKALLAKGADPKIKYNSKPLAFYAACDDETLKLITAAGANVKEKSDDGKTIEDMKKTCVVQNALGQTGHATSKSSLSQEAQEQLYTLSSQIVANKPLADIKSTLFPIAGLNILPSDVNGNIIGTDKPFIDPLVAAVTLNRDVGVVEALLGKQAAPNKTYKQVPIIFYAVCNGNLPVTQSLLKAGVDPAIKHPNGMGLKEFANKCNKPDVATALSSTPKS
ncbi:hypothetical protein GC177_10945 [bacterium]|nr:hypothetical protein [bacterium]